MTDPDLDHDFDERLRRLGRALDHATPPVSAEEARSRTAGRGRPRWASPALAVAACVVVAGLAGMTLAQRTADTSVVAGRSDGPGSDTTTTPSTTPSTTTPSTTAPPGPTGPLPGERIEIYPYTGARLAVVGVAADDTLNVRTGPGPEYPVAFTLDPLADDLRSTGHNRSVGNGFWSEIDFAGLTGWASSRFLLQPGLVEDVTARWYPSPSDRPSATTMKGLTDAIELRSKQEVMGNDGSEESGLRVVVVDGPGNGDLAEVTIDVIGLHDDAAAGVRLHVFAERAAGRFNLRTIEAMALCSRGVTDDGHCV